MLFIQNEERQVMIYANDGAAMGTNTLVTELKLGETVSVRPTNTCLMQGSVPQNTFSGFLIAGGSDLSYKHGINGQLSP